MATVFSGVADYDHSVVLLYEQSFYVAAEERNEIDQFASMKSNIFGKSTTLTKYSKLDKATTALTDETDPDGAAMVDTEVVFTPAEYGNVVSPTKLAFLQSAGKADLGAAQVVGINMRETMNAIGIQALEASTNILYGGSATADGELVAASVLTGANAKYIQNRLARQNAIMWNVGAYAALAHPDIISDIKDDNTAAWQDVQKYADAVPVLKNELGFWAGFRWIASTGCTVTADGGSGNVDLYKPIFFGVNALGRASSEEPHLVFTGPFDKLGRTIHIGWYGVVDYGIVDQNALYCAHVASAYGANT